MDKNSIIKDLEKCQSSVLRENEFIIKAGALALIMLLRNKSKNYEPYKEPEKSEKEIKIIEYIKNKGISDRAFYNEKYKRIELKTTSLSMKELKDIADILEVEDVNFEVEHDYDGCLESVITWE